MLEYQNASHDVFFFSKCCYEPISMSFGYSTSKTFMQFAEYSWCMNDGYVEIIKWILIMCILYSVCITYLLRQIEQLFDLDAIILLAYSYEVTFRVTHLHKLCIGIYIISAVSQLVSTYHEIQTLFANTSNFAICKIEFYT